MPRRKKQVGRVGLCNCGEEMAKKGINVRYMCDGTKYVTETTCRNHRKKIVLENKKTEARK